MNLVDEFYEFVPETFKNVRLCRVSKAAKAKLLTSFTDADIERFIDQLRREYQAYWENVQKEQMFDYDESKIRIKTHIVFEMVIFEGVLTLYTAGEYKPN